MFLLLNRRVHPLPFALLALALFPLSFSFPTAANAQAMPSKKWVVAPGTTRDLGDKRGRVALVVACAGYKNGTPLKNPLNDADDMTVALTNCGFDVLTVREPSKQVMVQAIVEFGKRLGPDTIALFYYSGHGIQISGKNYLLPVDFAAESEAQAEFDGVEARRVLQEMATRKSSLNVVILDACRNNPFEKAWGARTAGDGEGLAQMTVPRGTLLAYATAPDSTADDNRDGRNGLYTQELLKAMRIPGIRLQEVFERVAVSVAELSRDKQEPWSQAGPLRGEFRFVPSEIVSSSLALDTKARLTVTVNAPNAVINVDGQDVQGGKYVTNMLDDEEREIRVKVTANGYDGQLIPVKLLRGRSVTLPVKLEAIVVKLVASTTPMIPRTEADAEKTLAAGDVQKAIAIYSELIEATPKKFKLHFGRGTAYFTAKQYEKSITDFGQFIALRPALVEGYLNRARAYKELGKADEGLADLAKARSLDVARVDAKLQGDLYMLKKDYSNARIAYSKIPTKENPPSGTTYFLIGDTYAEQGDIDNAITSYGDGIKVAPKNPYGYSQRGRMYITAKQYDLAIKDLNQYITLAPSEAYGYYLRAVANVALKTPASYASAKADLDKYLSMEKDAANIETGKNLLATVRSKIGNSVQISGSGTSFDTIVEARIMSRKRPQITDEMKATNPKKIVVEFTVAANGSSSFKIVSSSGNPDVDEAVKRACETFRWTAATKDGKPVESRQRMIFDPSG